ncbi:MAG: hydrogenase small subunit [Coriobacteriia bacterium]|nr:hydrogenase small subunit [Coriobacteriia bacterium]
MTKEETRAISFDSLLEQRGVTRRDFMVLCGGVAVALGLSQAMVPTIAHAIEENVIGKATGKLMPALWLELASCTGCTESFAQVDTPDVATVVLELLSLNYAETLSAGAGHSLEAAKDQTIEAGGYALLIEGAIMEGWDGNALRIGWDGKKETFEDAKGTNIVLRAAKNAAAIIATGSCAVDGGWQAAYPNPGGAIGVQLFLEKAKKEGKIDTIPPIINLPLCPANPEHVVAVVVDVLLLKALPDLNKHNKPKLMFDQTIHDNCPRRGHFENGEFVYHFGSKEEALGYCLYPLGCKGPQTKSNCPVVRWNRRASWCVESGAPCAGCAVADPTRQGLNWVNVNSPFLKRFRTLNLSGLRINPTTVAFGLGGLVVVALVAHGFGMKVTGRTKGGAPFELERKWDKNNPKEALCSVEAARKAAEVREKSESVVDAVEAADVSAEGGDN